MNAVPVYRNIESTHQVSTKPPLLGSRMYRCPAPADTIFIEVEDRALHVCDHPVGDRSLLRSEPTTIVLDGRLCGCSHHSGCLSNYRSVGDHREAPLREQSSFRWWFTLATRSVDGRRTGLLRAVRLSFFVTVIALATRRGARRLAAIRPGRAWAAGRRWRVLPRPFWASRARRRRDEPAHRPGGQPGPTAASRALP